MHLKDRFDALADEWEEHCTSVMLSSDIHDYLNHHAYIELVALRADVIPFIINRYKSD